jgi:hypothetical protein
LYAQVPTKLAGTVPDVVAGAVAGATVVGVVAAGAVAGAAVAVVYGMHTIFAPEYP